MITIASREFYECTGQVSISIGKYVTSIEEGALLWCYSLVEVINKSSLTITKGNNDNGWVSYFALNVKTSGPSDIINKDEYLFLTSIENGTNYLINYIGDDTSLLLPNDYNDNTYEIYDRAFFKNTKINSVVITNSVTSIWAETFFDCTNLKAVYYMETFDGWNNITINSDGNELLTSANIYYYSEEETNDTNYNYWRYVDGKPTAW